MGRRIRKYRNRLNWTQRELAVRLELTHQNISKYELGANIVSAELLLKIAQIMDIRLHDFCRGLEVELKK
jgi:transcriptional regulator with XRE-family HTH domain